MRLDRSPGVGASITSIDPRSVTVLGLGSDNRSNTAADMFQVTTDGQYVYATVALGGSGGSVQGTPNQVSGPSSSRRTPPAVGTSIITGRPTRFSRGQTKRRSNEGYGPVNSASSITS